LGYILKRFQVLADILASFDPVRVLLENNVALKWGLRWIDVIKFESRVTEAQQGVETMENEGVIKGRLCLLSAADGRRQ
jgi:hypothetical protein